MSKINLGQAGPDFITAEKAASAARPGGNLRILRWGSGASSLGRRLSLFSLPALVVAFLAFASAPGAALAAGDANAASCPNEAMPGFRTYLPDCRAYEQVSPVFKQGFEPKVEAVSEDGEHLIMRSLGGFAGLQGGDTIEGAKFELSRSPAGWQISPLSPPTSMFPAQELDAASPDLSKTLFSARTAGESVVADNLYLREADGTIGEIGPFFPPAATEGPAAGEYDQFRKGQTTHYVDASANLSHVLYTMYRPSYEHDAWPGDPTIEGESLLEYSGIDNSEPVLVGVKPGPDEAKDRPSEDPVLVSTCGTFLGSHESHDVYNAVSSDGDTVFFTAEQTGCSENGVIGMGPEVNELYARLGGRESIAISEPLATQCEACATGAKASAEFVGASQNGSKVFFLTEQELLPGAEGPSLYEYDFDNPAKDKIVRVSTGAAKPEVQGVVRVSEDGSHVYFVARGVLTAEPDRSLPAGHQQALAGGDNLYVFERDAANPAGRVSFVAMLCSGLEESGTLEHVAECPSSRSDVEDWQQSDIRPAQATPDGRFLVFKSVADLTEGDTSEQRQIFEYDALTGELVRVSKGSDDDEPQGTASADLNPPELYVQFYYSKVSPAIVGSGLAVSANGANVVFADMGALTREAEVGVAGSNPQESEYEYRSLVGSGGSIGEGDVYLIAPPGPPEPQLDASAQDVFALVGAPLVPEDSDTQFDIYDARVDGGFPAPVSPVSCAGEACQGTPASAPPPPSVIATPAEGNFAPPSVVAPPRKSTTKKTTTRCKKGFTKKRNKCVRNKKTKTKRAKKNAGTNQGARS